MSTMKRCISLLLVLGILLGILAPAAQAAPVEEHATVDTSDVNIEGTNGFGNLLAQEVAENQQETEMENEDYPGGTLSLTWKSWTMWPRSPTIPWRRLYWWWHCTPRMGCSY